MTVHPSAARRFLWLGTVLAAAISILFLAKIIPVVSADQRAASAWPVNAFWVCLGFNSLAAIVLCFYASNIASVTRRAALVFCFLMVMALLFAFALSDAAFTFHSHGPALRATSVLLHFCSATDFLIASFVLLAVVLLPRRR